MKKQQSLKQKERSRVFKRGREPEILGGKERGTLTIANNIEEKSSGEGIPENEKKKCKKKEVVRPGRGGRHTQVPLQSRPHRTGTKNPYLPPPREQQKGERRKSTATEADKRWKESPETRKENILRNMKRYERNHKKMRALPKRSQPETRPSTQKD